MICIWYDMPLCPSTDTPPRRGAHVWHGETRHARRRAEELGPEEQVGVDDERAVVVDANDSGVVRYRASEQAEASWVRR